MNNREITFTVAEEDVRAISVSVINLILQRFGATYQQNLVKVNEALTTKQNIDILASLQGLIGALESSIKELEQTADLIQHIEEDKEAPLYAPDLNPVEDLKKKDLFRE